MPRRGNNIRKRQDGRWEGRILLLDNSGEKKYKSIYAHTYKDLKKKMSSYNLNHHSVSKEVTVEKIANDWLENKRISVKLSTYTKYKNIYYNHIHESIGKIAVSKLTEDNYKNIIINEYSKSHLSKSTINSIKYILANIIKSANSNLNIDVIKDNAAAIRNQYTPITIFTENEQTKLFTYLSSYINMYNIGLITCMLTGIRLGELCGLRNQDIDMNNRIIHIHQTVQRLPDGKGHTKLYATPPKSASSVREIPICDTLYKLLRSISFDGEFFLSNDKMMDPRTIQKYYKKTLNTIEIEYRKFHTLRHTFATNCINNGMDIKCLSEILGHSNVQITLNKYVHPSMKVKHDSINKCTAIYGQISGQ